METSQAGGSGPGIFGIQLNLAVTHSHVVYNFNKAGYDVGRNHAGCLLILACNVHITRNINLMLYVLLIEYYLNY